MASLLYYTALFIGLCVEAATALLLFWGVYCVLWAAVLAVLQWLDERRFWAMVEDMERTRAEEKVR